MKMMKKASALFVAILLAGITTFANVTSAQAEQIDVDYLQTCLKSPNASLDVLVLMDSSKSLRNGKPGEPRKVPQGSDPERKRGPILESSLNILQRLAEESDADFNISLRNFGKNSDPDELKKLQERWIDWTPAESGNSIKNFVDKALFDDSPGTQWANGLSSAKSQFSKRIGEAQVNGGKSCPIMFWITDGAPTDPTEPICQDNTTSSLNWFRENNVLVLGGLLMPLDPVEAAKAKDFKPLVEGESCGRNEQGWTRGSVIEANDVSDLAWRFVGLIAAIKNLVNLNGDNSTFNVDPSTSHIEIFTRRSTSPWQIKMPDGSEFCSSTNHSNNRCRVTPDPTTGITTITVYPEKPILAAGPWTITPALSSEDFLAYGGLDTSDPTPKDRSARLVISPNANPVSAEEGKDSTFQVKLVNPDGSDFSLEGFKSIDICASVASSPIQVCKSGKTNVSLTVRPNSSDKSVDFVANLVSSRDSSRTYPIRESVRIEVLLSGVFPRLVCEKVKDSQCILTNLPNKNSKAVSKFEIVAAEPGMSGGEIYIKDFVVLVDEASERGDEHFFFQVTRSNGQLVNLNDPAQPLVPGEHLTLTVTTDKAGSGDVKGIIKYRVVADGQEIERQLPFAFGVSNAKDPGILFGLMLLAYLLTVGLPYLYLLMSARRRAVLNVADDAFSYFEKPATITEDGRVEIAFGTNESDGSDVMLVDLLRNETIENGTKTVQVGSVKFEVIPPKWNPFVNPVTIASVPGSHIISTFGGTGFSKDSVHHTQALVGEALIFFKSDEALSPELYETSTTTQESSRTSLYEESPASSSSSEWIKKSGPVAANVIFIVPRYVNRTKALETLMNRFKNVTEGADIGKKISEMRAQQLDEKNREIDQAQSQEKGSEDSSGEEDKQTITDLPVKEETSVNRFSLFGDEPTGNTDSTIDPNFGEDDNGSTRKLWD